MKKARIFALSALCILFVFPVFATALKSLSYGGAAPTLAAFWELFTTDYTYLKYFWNSVLYASVSTFLSVAISLPLGFLFAKVKFNGREALFFVFIAVMMLPFQATLLPNYIQLKSFNLLNTRLALILPAVFSPFAVFFLRQSIKNIPNEVIDYALLETSSAIKLFKYAVIPQIKPAICSLAILIFCESWNILEQALIFLPENKDIYPLSAVLESLPEDVKYAGGTVYMLPIIMLFLIFGDELQSSMKNYKI